MIAVPVPVKRLFDWKVRGVRCVEIIGVVCVAALVFSVYIAKAAAARESAEISRIESEIRENRQRVRLLRAEVTRLEALGAHRVAFVRSRWWVMEAPTGHRFCVVPMKEDASRGEPTRWE